MSDDKRNEHLMVIQTHLNDNGCSDHRIVEEVHGRRSDWHVYNISFISSREEKDEFERTLRDISTQLYAVFEFRPGLASEGYYIHGSTRDSRRFAEDKLEDIKSRIHKLDEQGHL